ncbi:MAG: SPOR domain-containing protein [Flavobacteriales bacterium]|nr:SPOR domain-containing protein [Flavobacteriales bacterium]
MGIERDLFDLLYEHDCVIVPRWGGFLAQYRPARLDEGRRLIHPPGKEVGFNRHLLRNDGLLADLIAKREGITFSAANVLIEREVDLWRTGLERQGRLELPRIGIFYRDAERNLQFDPDDRANFLKEAFGLRALAAVPAVVKEAVIEPRVIPLPSTKTEPVERRSWMWAAAASSLVIIGAAAFWAYRSLDQGNAQWSGPWEPAPAPTYVPSTEPLPQMTASASVFSLPEETLGIRTLPLTTDDSVTITVDLGTPAVAAPADTTVVATPAKTLLRARFHVIGGCFAQPENADRLLADLQGKGYPAARLARYGDLHPVAYGSYPDRETALDALATVRRNASAQAWLLVR